MKVLWFANTPCNADEYFNNELKSTGGWLKSLDKEIQNYVDLHIAFYHNKEQQSFKYDKTTYHPIYVQRTVIKKIYDRFFNHVIDEEHRELYIDIIEKVKPDIIHIHGTENSFGCVIPFINIPVVVSIQGIITVSLHKYFSGFDKDLLKLTQARKSNFFLRESFCSNFKRFRKMAFIEQKNLLYTKFIIGRTDWDRRVTQVLAPQSRYFYVSEILRDFFYKKKWQVHNRTHVVLHTTNSNTYYKGFETLCLALYELNKLGVDCEWNVAGIMSTDLIVKTTKIKLGNKYPLRGLNLLGNLNQYDLASRLLDSDIYVMTSHIENSPNNLCEAMMLGMPCISTFVGGSGSLMKDKESGLLIQNGDPWSLAGAILELVQNKELAISYAQNARREALDRHDQTKIIRNLIDVYKDTLEEKS